MRIGILKTDINSDDSFENKLHSLGDNTGNMVFWHSLNRLLKTENIPYNYRDIGFDISVYDAIVCTDLIWIREGSNFNYLNKILDDTTVPLIPISVGLQASSYDMNFKLTEDTVKLLKRIEERAVIGVRGEYTGKILHKYGICNFSVIGCPSMYYWNNPDLQIADNATTLKNILVNFRTIYGSLNKHEKHFLSYAADKNATFIEQTCHILQPENTNDEKYFSYVSKWMAKNKKMYFCVEDWMDSTCQNDFSMGARFHGNVISLWNNIKSLFITVDSRTRELTDFFNLPSIPMSDFDPTQPIEYYYEKADYKLFNQTYKEKFNNFVQFLESNGLYIDDDVESLEFYQSPVEKQEYVNNISNASNIKIIANDIVDDVIAYKKTGKNMKIILYGDTQLNRWKYRPQLKRMDIDIYAYYIPNSHITKLDGIKIINKEDLKALEDTVFILASTEPTLASVDIAEISALPLKDAYVYTHFTSKASMIINDKFRIIDKENYSKSFPWYFELVYDNISASERSEFMEGFPFLKNAIAKNNYLAFADYSSKYLNIVNGARLTTDVPQDKPKNHVYFFGDSRIYGDGVPDRDTIESNLQRILNQQYQSLGYEVVNYGVPSLTPQELFLHLKNIVLEENDVVIFSTDTDLSSKMEVALSLYERCQLFVEPLMNANEYCKLSKAFFYFFELGNINCIEKPSAVEMFIKDAFDITNDMLQSRMKFWGIVEKIAVANHIAYFNISYAYNRPHSYGEIFYDPYHFGPKGNKLIADEIFNIISLKHPFVAENKHTRIKNISEKFYNQINQELNQRHIY